MKVIKKVWKILHCAEKELVNLLLIESSKVEQKTEKDLQGEIRTQYSKDYDSKKVTK